MKRKIIPSINILILFVFLAFACSKKQNFKYAGKYPEWNYSLPNIEKNTLADIKGNDSNKIAYRNRIYITINEKNELLINNNKINKEDFREVFKYLYTNPNRLKHLPESEEKTIILFINNSKTSHLGKPLFNYGLHLIIDEDLLYEINTIINGCRENHISNFVNNEISDSILKDVKQKFPLNIAYSIRKTNTKPSALEWLHPEESSVKGKLKSKNIIQVLVKANDEVHIRNEHFPLEMITPMIKKMILNVEKNEEFPENTKSAIISLKNEREADYEIYIKVYNYLQNAYFEIRNERSNFLFGYGFDSLNTEYQKLIRKEIPLVISEAEPAVDY